MIEIVAAGLLASVQDFGRRGLRRSGVPWAGTLVPEWLPIANALVGNAPGHPAIELVEAGLSLKVVDAPTRIAFAGDLEVTDDEGLRLSAWRSHTLAPGRVLRVRSTGLWRLGLLAIGGLELPSSFGSASTYARAGLGGIDGRALETGDGLRAGIPDAGPERSLSLAERPPRPRDGATIVLHAVPGPQDDAFDASALDAFFDLAGWRIGGDADRMGARLEGPTLEHRDAASRDIVSDAILPGSVQVPGAGQPIVMLADAHTIGGYPKIATVASADLSRLALARPGDRIRFERIDVDGAVALARESATCLRRRLAAVEPVFDGIDPDVLMRENLVDGVTDGSAPGE